MQSASDDSPFTTTTEVQTAVMAEVEKTDSQETRHEDT